MDRQPMSRPQDQASMNEFERILARYRQAMIEYKTTGNSTFKMQSETDRKWLDEYTQWLQSQADSQTQNIQKFIADYQRSNPDLMRLQDQIRKVREEGPKLQNQLETNREAVREEPVDFTQYYIKGGLIAGVLGLIAVARAF
jgi:hypothetical protein